MSTTEQRTGFRLPWSTDGRAHEGEASADPTADGDAQATDAPEATAADAPPSEATSTDATEATADPEADMTTKTDGAVATAEGAEDAPEAANTGEPIDELTWPEVDRRVRQMGRRAIDRADATLADITAGFAVPAARRTNALMAGLSKAMHAAAESARTETLDRLAADAAQRTEAIKASSTEEAAAVKLAAETDIARVRDWSKAELARVREETESKIAARREALERETEAHAARIEARVERVKRIVAAFEATMAEFFTILLDETDPARVALMAEQLPEPPSLEVDDELEAAFEAFEAEADAADAADSAAADDAAPMAETGEVEIGETETNDAPSGRADDELIGDTPEVGSADPAEDADAAAAAEAEALAAATETPATEGESDDVPSTLSEEGLATRLAKMDTADAKAKNKETDLVVTGLVSVAGIAGFKRAVSRIPGVSGVGVTSGPGGEFVYSVSHSSEIDFNTVVAAMPGFSARVTGGRDGAIQITASDHSPDN